MHLHSNTLNLMAGTASTLRYCTLQQACIAAKSDSSCWPERIICCALNDAQERLYMSCASHNVHLCLLSYFEFG